MKKIFSIITVLLSFSLQGFAQQYINLYQDDVVIKQYSTEEIDSMSITETEPRIVSFWRDGDAFQTYNAADIDSIKVSNRGGAPFSYIGIVGFNDQLNTSDIGILSPATASQYKSFVNNNLPKRDGTILYYAVDNALDMLENANIESPLKSVNVITFTDGLDQGSLMLTDKYSSSADYLNALGERIATTRIEDLPVNSYSVGLRGSDVSNVTLFKQNLQRLASSEEKAFEVSSISDLRYKFQDIANQIISVSTRQTMSVRVPGVDNGTRMRFVFDGKSAANSELYIEGTFDLQDRSLHDVTYQGIKATSGKTVQGTQDGIFVTYTFTGMRRDAGTSLIPTSSVKHYYMYPSSTSWQANSEFTPTGNTQRNVSHSGTSIMLVLDCSSSLGSDFSRMQQYANEFIDLIASNAEPFELLTPKNVKAQLDEDELVVNVSWDEVKYARTYNIYRNSSSSGTYQLVAEGVTTNSWTDESPLKGYNYYKVCAVNRNKVTSQSSYASANVVLDTPTNVRTELTAKNEKLVINVTWNGVKYAQNYKVYRSSSYNGTYELVADHLTSTSWTDESPVNDNNYYKVSATSHGIESSRSDYSYISYKLNAPTNVKAQLDDNALVVNVSWDAVKFAQSYNVYRSNSDTGIYTMVAEGVTSTSWTDNNPMQGFNYYKVCAIGHGFTSSKSSYASANIILDTPTNVKAALDANALIVNVSWSAVKYGQSYKIFRSSSSNGTYEMVADDITTTSWTDNSPMEGDNYYKVCAVGYGLTSTQSSYASVNITLNAPTNVKAEIDPNDLVVNISWTAVKYAQSYKIYRSSASDGTFTLVAENIIGTSWTDNSPLDGKNYYRLYAVGYGLTSTYASAYESTMSYVDLGLPSGTLWATCNIGANSPEDYGDYFAWGETEGYDSGKTNFSWSTYKWCNGSSSSLTKYKNSSLSLALEDDAAYVNWGPEWRMPSKAQFEELINSSYTTTEWTTLNGVKGRKITSKKNGNSIFLPAAGYRYDSSLRSTGSYGYYWSRTLDSGYPSYAWDLGFDSSGISTHGLNGRGCGRSVRPVHLSE